ncbi:Spa1-related 2-like isoform x1 [Thalictrum thalictroides]|uniref:Spa1-related 2-like isoform x1 n=1 Tax=Thalictrum thalictroides TaxID=46969 RepID=A0A7J6WF31_THATH|nr:Spa1-related 2-like isoform x1 [Thalictrum thalictroides]
MMEEREGEEAIEDVRLREKGKGIVSSNPMFDWRESSQQIPSDSFVSIDLNKLQKTEPALMNSCFINDDINLVKELTLNVCENSSVVEVDNSKETPVKQVYWKHLYRMAGGVGTGSSHCENASKDGENNYESPSGIRTKLLSSSGLPQYLVRNSLKGKGVIHRSSELRDGFGVKHIEQINEKTVSVGNSLMGKGVRSSEMRDGFGVKHIEQINEKTVSVGNSLMGKGVIHRFSELSDGFGVKHIEQINEKTVSVGNSLMGKVIHRSSELRDGFGVKHLEQINEKTVSVGNSLMGKGVIDRSSELRDGFGVTHREQINEKTVSVGTSLKGKGVIHRSSGPGDGFGVTHREQINEKNVSVGGVISDASLNLGVKGNQSTCQSVHGAGSVSIIDEVFLRDCLKPACKVNKDERLRIFTRIVELVDIAHSQQVVLQHVRPSCFKLLPSDQVKYMGSVAQRELFENVIDMDVKSLVHPFNYKRNLKEGLPPSSTLKRQKLKKNMSSTRQRCQSSAGSGFKGEPAKNVDFYSVGSQASEYATSQKFNLNHQHKMQNKFTIPFVCKTTQNHLTPANIQLEEDMWYTSPEEENKREPTFSSDVYCLGVLLFELLCCFESCEVHAAAMLNLRYRILPPKFLSEYPREAGFCLWLLHPEPSSRPTAREILHSELIRGSLDVSKGQQSIHVDEDPTESELLLHFLISLKELKHKCASKMVEDIRGIEADIEEVEKRHILRTTEAWKHKEPSNTVEFHLKEPASSQARLLNNRNQLENAYFSMRSQILVPDPDGTDRPDNDLLNIRESCLQVVNEGERNKPSDHLGVFFDGLCKYARYNKFELRGTLRNTDLLNSTNVICSLSFDRDEEYFAAASVSKKIKIFEFSGLLKDSVDNHYPVVEMTSKSKLSCVCWNNYIRNYLAATDYDGVVQLWDASTGQGISQYTDHAKRAWSVDFSSVDPTKFASCSDDFSVKLWSINERKCTSTIKSSMIVCCVQFSTDSTNLVAFGSADRKTYCYDLRNTRNPWCTLAGHGKAVSFVKFLDSETLVSASTDNTLKLWDLNKTNCSGLSTNSCSLTFRGHTNVQNFVGLSVSDGYIACGSESNEVYAYYRSLPMPITAHKFGSMDPISGQENGDDSKDFVSSVCWKGKSDMVIAANSRGSIKLLQMM